MKPTPARPPVGGSTASKPAPPAKPPSGGNTPGKLATDAVREVGGALLKMVENVNPWRLALRLMLKPTELGKDDVYVMPDGKRNPNLPAPKEMPKVIPGKELPKPAPKAPQPPNTGKPLSLKDLMPQQQDMNRGRKDRLPEAPDDYGGGAPGWNWVEGVRVPIGRTRASVEVGPGQGEEPSLVGSVSVPIRHSGLQMRGRASVNGQADQESVTLYWKAWWELNWTWK